MDANKIAKKEAKKIMKENRYNEINDFKTLSRVKENYEVKIKTSKDLADYYVFLMLTEKLDKLKLRNPLYY